MEMDYIVPVKQGAYRRGYRRRESGESSAVKRRNPFYPDIAVFFQGLIGLGEFIAADMPSAAVIAGDFVPHGGHPRGKLFHDDLDPAFPRRDPFMAQHGDFHCSISSERVKASLSAFSEFQYLRVCALAASSLASAEEAVRTASVKLLRFKPVVRRIA